MPRAMRFWPGLQDLWNEGSGAGLALAVGFTALVNLLLMATLIWTDWLGEGMRWIGWIVAAVLWVAAWWTASDGTSIGADGEPGDDAVFAEAQRFYLGKNWFQAETLLCRLIAAQPKDVEAKLMLATLKRHTGRWQEAEELLEQLHEAPEAATWKAEIDRERTLVAALVAEGDSPLMSSADPQETSNRYQQSHNQRSNKTERAA